MLLAFHPRKISGSRSGAAAKFPTNTKRIRTMKTPPKTTSPLPEKDACVVMVLYEDDATRRRAITAHDQLIQSRSANIDFEFHWWRTHFLTDPELAAGAAEHAARADVFMVCSTPEMGPSPRLRTWFGDWARRRDGRPGALANLTTTSSTDDSAHPASEDFLREICAQAKLDFLGSFPSAPHPASFGGV
jgi:hypothetical protein